MRILSGVFVVYLMLGSAVAALGESMTETIQTLSTRVVKNPSTANLLNLSETFLSCGLCQEIATKEIVNIIIDIYLTSSDAAVKGAGIEMLEAGAPLFSRLFAEDFSLQARVFGRLEFLYRGGALFSGVITEERIDEVAQESYRLSNLLYKYVLPFSDYVERQKELLRFADKLCAARTIAGKEQVVKCLRLLSVQECQAMKGLVVLRLLKEYNREIVESALVFLGEEGGLEAVDNMPYALVVSNSREVLDELDVDAFGEALEVAKRNVSQLEAGLRRLGLKRIELNKESEEIIRKAVGL